MSTQRDERDLAIHESVHLAVDRIAAAIDNAARSIAAAIGGRCARGERGWLTATSS